MGKKAELLAEQIETVNTEMSRLGLPKISGNKEEEALVDSAYDQMGVNVLLQNVAILVAVSLPLISFQFMDNGLGRGFSTLIIIAILIGGLTAFFNRFMASQQSAKAVELVVMYRSNNPRSSNQ